MLTIGDRVRALRDERNLSQEQLARKVGMKRATIATYESGSRLPSLSSLIALSRVFGVTTDYLLGVSDERANLLDVSGLTPRQIASLDLIIENYRECNGTLDEETEA